MLYHDTRLSQYHLGLWYGSYRCIIALCLLIVFFTNISAFSSGYLFPQVYFFTLIVYVIFSSIQLVSYFIFKSKINRHITLFFSIDVIAYSLLTFASHGSNFSISLLFTITIFAASILLESKKALIITLIAVIGVVYQYIAGSLFSIVDLKNIENSALLAIIFLFVYVGGQITIKRFRSLEKSNYRQSLELHQLQNINRHILEQIETGYLVLTQTGDMILSNPASRKLLGIKKPQETENVSLQYLQPDLFQRLDLATLQDGDKFQFTSHLTEYHTVIHIQELKVPQQTLILLTIQDAKLLNQQVQQLKLAALGQLSASIAHEIRNPLAAIMQANQLYLQSSPVEQKQLTEMIDRQALRMNKIIEDTLGMAKNKDTVMSQIFLDQFLDQFLQEDLSDIYLKIKVESEPHLSIFFDESQLRQVLTNLIRNAIRHNNPNYSDILIKIYQQEKVVKIDIQDFGSGVAKQNIKDLFQPFFSTDINGTGLGLYLSMSFCEANQAKLTYIEQEFGACFRIECSTLAVI